ncbi:MAG: CatA-like O-acetyltransferase [Clostridia bacterium]|nr:CatA-like O-acetyltransferase [Clostridia bacterium]
MKYIDETTWERREICKLFSNIGIPFYSVTIPMDVTELYSFCKAKKLSFYHGMIYVVMKACNEVEAFRYKLRRDGIVLHERLSPSFTYPRENDLFGICNVEWEAGESLVDFCSRAKRAQEGAVSAIPSDEDEQRDDFVYISCLPWFSVTHVAQEVSLDPNESIPRLLWDRLRDENGRKCLSMVVQVNHRLIDGVHIHRWLEAVKREIAALS